MTGTTYQPDEVIATVDVAGTYQLRAGGCTAGCGACCEFLILPLDQRLKDADPAQVADFVYWAKLHGISISDSGDWYAARIPLACKHLTEDKLCGVIGTDERPDMCGRYPRLPLDLEGVEDVCTYTFESITDRAAAFRRFVELRKGITVGDCTAGS